MADYFLSLNVASSKAQVDRARSIFHRHGISTWMCTDIDGGDTFREEILANVRDAKVFLIFLNEKWAKSQECTFECNYAMRKNLVKAKPVIMPIVTERFDMEKYAHVDGMLANFQGVFLSDCDDEDEGFKLVMKKLENVVPYQAAAAARPAPKPAKLSAAESKEISIVKKSLTSKGAQTLPSGKWQGYFVDKRALQGHAAGSQWLIDVNITFQSGNKFTGEGEDDVGPFTFINGNISGSKVHFVKEYATHRVIYNGEVMGVQMVGRWRLETAPQVNGDWAMWPIS